MEKTLKKDLSHTILLHFQGTAVTVDKRDIECVAPRSFGDITHGSILISGDERIEVDESQFEVLRLFSLVKAA